MNLTGLVRARIVTEGDVQKVGYRDLVQNIAMSLGIKGYVENLKDGTVQIICETGEDTLKKFIKKIKVKQDFIDVKKARIVEITKATGEFGYFDIKYGPIEYELGERLGPAIKYAGAMRQDIRDMRGDIKEVHGELKEGTAGIQRSIGDMHKDIKTMHTDLKEGTAGVQRSIEEMRGDLKTMHTDLKEGNAGIQRSIEDMRGDLKTMHTDLKEGTVGVQRSIEEMHKDINQNFQEMSKRYDAISGELVRSREELTRAVDNLSRLIDEFIRQQRSGS
jgi:acylphosphatase